MSKIYLTIGNLRYCFDDIGCLEYAFTDSDYNKEATWVYDIKGHKYIKGSVDIKDLYGDYLNAEMVRISHPFEVECEAVFEKYCELTNKYVDGVDEIDTGFEHVFEELWSKGSVVFQGSRSFYGSWEEDRVTIPAKFFTDTENAFKEYEEELIEKQKIAKEKD